MRCLSVRSAILFCVMAGPCLFGAEIPADTVLIRFLDPEGRAVSNVGVGTRGIGRTIGQSSWEFGFSDSTKAVSDANGVAVLDYRASHVGKNISLYALQSERRLGGAWQLPGSVFVSLVTLSLEPACRVTGRATCSVWQERGLPVARTWIDVRQGGREVACFSGARPEFEFFLPPGSYQLEIEGQELVPTTVALEVAPSSKELAIGAIDLAPTKLGGLLGMSAPELDHIREWVQGPPVTLADHRGQHVLLHFCRWDRWGPQYDLLRVMEICDAFDEKHLKVVILINYLPRVEELQPRLEEMEETVGRALPCAIGVDADGGTEKVLGHNKVRIGATFLNYGVFGQYVRSRTLLVEPGGRLDKRCYLMESQKFIAELAGLIGTARKTPDWEIRLIHVYGLADGEVLKYVPQPFISERRIFRMQRRAKRDVVYFGTRRDDWPHVWYMCCEWDGSLHWEGGGSSGVRLYDLLDVRRADLAGPADLLRYDLSGDWVVHSGTSLRERHRALETYLKKEFGLSIRIEQRDVEKEVIVVRGRFKLNPLAAARNRDVIHVYTREQR